MDFRFELFEDVRNINDSMELDSGTTICRLVKGTDEVAIEVRGEVDVYWYPNGTDYDYERYRYPSDFPMALKELFRTGEAYNDNRVAIENNNWFEIFYNYDEDYDVVDIENYNPTELLDLCFDCLDLFKGV